MRRLKTLVILSLIPLMAACSTSKNTKQMLGIVKSTPDEFKVVTNPPLSVPPEFSLRPLPEDSARLASVDTKNTTAKFEPASANYAIEGTTEGESAFLNRMGTGDINPDIKNILESDAEKSEKKEKSFLDKIAGVTGIGSSKESSVVDAKKERERLAKNKDEGKLTTDGETPVVSGDDSGDKGLLNDVFGF